MKRTISFLLVSTFLLAAPVLAPAHDAADGKFMHHVFFWLNEPANAEHRELFLREIRKMKAIPAIQSVSIGTPAGTPRDVVDNSWTFDWLVTFEDKAGWQVYNDHPIHKKFVENAAHVWEKVQVYDSIKQD